MSRDQVTAYTDLNELPNQNIVPRLDWSQRDNPTGSNLIPPFEYLLAKHGILLKATCLTLGGGSPLYVPITEAELAHCP